MITYDDYVLWKNDPMTKAWFEACQIRVEEGKEQLATQAGSDPVFDGFVRGVIHAYREMMSFSVEELNEE